MSTPSFAVLSERNRYWEVEGQPYCVFERANVDEDDIDYVEWCKRFAPQNINAAELRQALHDAELPPFQSVTAVQARQAIRALGHAATLDAWFLANTDPYLDDCWEYSSEWYRDADWIATLQAQNGFTDAQMDQIFIQAATLYPED